MTRRDLKKNGAKLLYRVKMSETSWMAEYWQLEQDNPMQAYAGIYRTINYPSVDAHFCGPVSEVVTACQMATVEVRWSESNRYKPSFLGAVWRWIKAAL